MATNEQVRRLIESHTRGDERSFGKVAEDVIRQARTDQQDTLALDLEHLAALRAQRKRPVAVGSLLPLPLGRDDLPLVTLHDPSVSFTDLVLADPLRELLAGIVREHKHRELLAARGLTPRRRLLFAGPSGTGKSKTADAIASELGVPIAKVRLSAVVSSYLGETARHLEQIMDFASRGAWVLVFDEVDMLAGERDRDDHGEMRRVVAAFLQTLEESTTENLVIATTNHSTALDKAIWRRFDEVALFKLPHKTQIQELLRIKLRRMKGRVNRETVARCLLGLSQAEVEMVCLDAMRAATLDSRASLTTDDLVYSAKERRLRLEEAGRSLS